MGSPTRPPRSTPYDSQPARAFWRQGVSEPGARGIADLWQPKFAISPDDPVASYGSCFAQHIGRGLERHGFRWLVTERPPKTVPRDLAQAHGYGQFSARTGNIYTPSALTQWLGWALEERPVPRETWAEGQGLRDPFRPRIEPEPFESAAELEKLRGVTLKALRKSIVQARVVIFTLGLTERWVHTGGGYEYPLCPGTAAGHFDPLVHRFAPLDFEAALRETRKALDMMRSVNPGLNFLLTVSPVGLSATASQAHVLTATTGAKALLRAVAGQLADTRRDTDYFPSFELITSPVFGGRFLAPDRRRVTTAGVTFVLQHFFAGLGHELAAPSAEPATPDSRPRRGAVQCDEEILGAFGDRP